MFFFFFFLSSQKYIYNDNSDSQDVGSKKLILSDFSPKKGTKDGGFQFFVYLETKEDLPLWIKIGERINAAVNEGNGIYYVWAPPHEKGKVEVQISRDGIHWQYACEFQYKDDHPFGFLLISIIIFAIIWVGAQVLIRKLKKKPYHTRL